MIRKTHHSHLSAAPNNHIEMASQISRYNRYNTTSIFLCARFDIIMERQRENGRVSQNNNVLIISHLFERKQNETSEWQEIILWARSEWIQTIRI